MFETKRADGRSYREVALDVLKGMKPGEIVSYQDLGKTLELRPVQDRPRIQQAVRLANKQLLKLHQRGIKVVTGVGFRMPAANEHAIVGISHKSKADRSMLLCLQWFDGTNMSELTESERRLHQGQEMIMQAVYASHKSLDRRIQRLEDILDPKTIEGTAG